MQNRKAARRRNWLSSIGQSFRGQDDGADEGGEQEHDTTSNGIR